MNDLVSIITPSYNSEKFIVKTIQSVQKQTHKNWQMLIVDDASTDNTVSLVKQLMDDDPRIHLFQNTKNLGAAKTRNKAIEQVKGKYMAFLDADDLWLPNFIEKSILKIKETNVGFTYASLKDAMKTLNLFIQII